MARGHHSINMLLWLRSTKLILGRLPVASPWWRTGCNNLTAGFKTCPLRSQHRQEMLGKRKKHLVYCFFALRFSCRLVWSSSVARGGGGRGRARAFPIGLWSMESLTFLVLLRPIFGEKLKTAPPPPKEIGCRSCEVHVVIRSEKALEYPILAEKSVSISVKTFFFVFVFGDHLFLGGKNVWIPGLSEKFRLNFRTNRVILIQEKWKFGSRSFALFSLFQKAPPPLFQILATRLVWSWGSIVSESWSGIFLGSWNRLLWNGAEEYLRILEATKGDAAFEKLQNRWKVLRLRRWHPGEFGYCSVVLWFCSFGASCMQYIDRKSRP